MRERFRREDFLTKDLSLEFFLLLMITRHYFFSRSKNLHMRFIKSVISTVSALRRRMTSDDHPSIPSLVPRSFLGRIRLFGRGRTPGHRRASEPGQSVNVLLLNGELELQNVTSLVSTEGEKLRLGMATASAAAVTRRRTRIGGSSSDCQAHV